jgi:hypothetical protein
MGVSDSSMVEKRNFKTHPVTNEEVKMSRWYAVEDDLIGGTLIATVNKPASLIDPYAGEFEVATFVSEGMANHLVELHNTWLEIEVWKTYSSNIFTTHANELEAARSSNPVKALLGLLDKNINKH